MVVDLGGYCIDEGIRDVRRIVGVVLISDDAGEDEDDDAPLLRTLWLRLFLGPNLTAAVKRGNFRVVKQWRRRFHRKFVRVEQLTDDRIDMFQCLCDFSSSISSRSSSLLVGKGWGGLADRVKVPTRKCKKGWQTRELQKTTTIDGLIVV